MRPKYADTEVVIASEARQSQRALYLVIPPHPPLKKWGIYIYDNSLKCLNQILPPLRTYDGLQ